MTKKEDQLFKKFLEFESRNLKDFATATGQSYNQIRKYSASGKWLEKAAEYDAKKAAEGVVDSVTTEDFGLAASHSRLLAFKAAPAISQADFNTILLHAEKISNGQFDFIPTLRAELKNKLGIDTADLLIDSINENPANSDNATRLFLAQFNFIVEGEGVNYHLVKLDDSTCELDIIPPAEVAENTGDTFSLTTETSVPKTPPADSATLLPFTNLTTPSRTLDQLAADFNAKIQKGDLCIKKGLIFYLDAGKDLVAAKKLVKHGDWENWLKAKSQYPIRRAQKYMQLADRFGYLVDKPEIAENLSVTQMFELLSLPEGEEQNFIDKLTAEGKALADMTQKETRAEVKVHNAEIERLQLENFMKIANRFSNSQTFANLGYSQMIQMLALPEGEEENFLAAKKAEGTPVEDMTVKNLREEVKAHNAEIERLQQEKEAEKERADKLQGQLDLFVDKLATAKTDIALFKKDRDDQLTKKQQAEKKLRDAQNVIDQKSFENETLQKKIQELENKPPVTVEITRDVIPPDHEENKIALADSQEQVAAAPAEVESLKTELAQLKATQADAAKRAETFATLNTVADILATVDVNFIKDFAREYPDKFKAICSLFATAD